MADSYDDLIDAQDLQLTHDEISAKALTLVRSIGLGETEEERRAIAAKARAYFKRAGALREPDPPQLPITFPSLSEIRWQDRHVDKSWEEIREEWIGLRSKIESLSKYEWSMQRIELLQELTRLEIFIEDCWSDQHEVVEQIRAERMADRAKIPPF